MRMIEHPSPPATCPPRRTPSQHCYRRDSPKLSCKSFTALLLTQAIIYVLRARVNVELAPSGREAVARSCSWLCSGCWSWEVRPGHGCRLVDVQVLVYSFQKSSKEGKRWVVKYETITGLLVLCVEMKVNMKILLKIGIEQTPTKAQLTQQCKDLKEPV